MSEESDLCGRQVAATLGTRLSSDAAQNTFHGILVSKLVDKGLLTEEDVADMLSKLEGACRHKSDRPLHT